MLFRWNTIGTAFQAKTNIRSFKEFTHFVNVHVVTAGAFMGSTLEEIEFPDVTVIQWNVFRNALLVEATVPATITAIREYSFYCTTLTKLTILATTPPAVTIPPANTTCLFYVPAASVDAYKNASGWSSLASRIYAIP